MDIEQPPQGRQGPQQTNPSCSNQQDLESWLSSCLILLLRAAALCCLAVLTLLGLAD